MMLRFSWSIVSCNLLKLTRKAENRLNVKHFGWKEPLLNRTTMKQKNGN